MPSDARVDWATIEAEQNTMSIKHWYRPSIKKYAEQNSWYRLSNLLMIECQSPVLAEWQHFSIWEEIVISSWHNWVVGIWEACFNALATKRALCFSMLPSATYLTLKSHLAETKDFPLGLGTIFQTSLFSID